MTTRRATMRRQGRGWIVSTYDPQVQAYRESGEMDYYRARLDVGRENCRACRKERAEGRQGCARHY